MPRGRCLADGLLLKLLQVSSAMQKLAIPATAQDDLVRVLSMLLLLGNVAFTQDDDKARRKGSDHLPTPNGAYYYLPTPNGHAINSSDSQLEPTMVPMAALGYTAQPPGRIAHSPMHPRLDMFCVVRRLT